MDYDAQQTIQNELEPTERLIWSGKPRQGIIFRVSDIFMIPFSLFWGGFAIFWESIAIIDALYQDTSGDSVLFPIFGIPFVAVGLYMIFGRFIHDKIRREKTFYGVSEKRVIIIESGIFRKYTTTLDIKRLNNISLKEKSDGTGTIVFGQESLWNSWRRVGTLSAMDRSDIPRFESIENAKYVFREIRNA